MNAPAATSATTSVAVTSGSLRRRRIASSWNVSSSSGGARSLSIVVIVPLLFVTKGFDRPENGRSIGGIDAEEEADGDAEAEREEHRVELHDRLHADDLEAAAEEPGRDAENPADDRQQNGLGEELGEDVAASRTDRLADADLAGSLGDADKHDVHHADAADEQ